MNISQKKFLSQYGPLFAIVWVGAFVLLVTLQQRGVDFPLFWGDILIKKAGLSMYLPFTSSVAVAAFAVAFWEMWRFMKRF